MTNKQETAPSLEVHLQYIKDLSFENPAPAKHLKQRKGNFETKVGIDVNYSELADTEHEVVLSIKVDVQSEKDTVYVLELHYAGVFGISGANDEMKALILLIECPRLLFPFARAIVSRITTESGFPSLDLKPIDFSQVVQHKMSQMEKAKE